MKNDPVSSTRKGATVKDQVKLKSPFNQMKIVDLVCIIIQLHHLRKSLGKIKCELDNDDVKK